MLDRILNEIPRLLTDYGLRVVGSLLFLLAVWIFARIVDRILRRMLRRRTDLDAPYGAVIARVVQIVILSLAVLAVLDELGVEISSLIAALGIFGFAIALGLRTSLSNFFTGLMIFVLKPYVVGDYIDGERVEGAVKRIGTFHTVVVTPDGTYVSVPNSAMWARSIRNLSRPQPVRVALTLTVGRERPFADLRKLIDKAVRAEPAFHSAFPPEIRITDTTEQTLVIHVGAWCSAEETWSFGTRLKAQIDSAIAEAGGTVKKLVIVRKPRKRATKPAPKPKEPSEDFT